MVKKSGEVLLLLLLVIGLTSAAFAQRQTGSLSGKVVDEAGAPLPGASVTLSGPALMGTLTYTTTEEGDFRFPALPPGRDYSLTVEISGFQKTTRTDLIISVARTVSLIVDLKATAISEEVTVTAPSPTIDVTSSKQGVTFSSELMDNIPLQRDYYDIVRAAPGIVTDNVDYRRGFASRGSGVRTESVAVEGVPITDTSVGTNKIGVSFDVYEEVEIGLGAHPAEVATTPGAYINIVTKSGGNEFHGGAIAYFFNKDMARTLIPAEEAKAAGLSAPEGLKSYNDYSVTLGGPIIKDKFWFFTNARYFKTVNQGETLLNGLFDMPHTEFDGFLKLTFQVHKNIKFTGMMSYRNFDEPTQGLAVNYYADKLSSYYFKGVKNIVALGTVNWILDQNTFFDIRFMYNKKTEPFYWNPAQDPSLPQFYDRYTRIYTGTQNFPQYDFVVPRTQISVSFNRFLDNFLGGNHELKVGAEYDVAPNHVPYWKESPITATYLYNGSVWGYQDIQPYMGYIEIWTSGEKKGDWPMEQLVTRWGGFLQDSFTIKDRLTVNLGLRYDDQRAGVLERTFKPVQAKDPVLVMLAPNIFKEFTFPENKNIYNWKILTPRVGIVYDLFGDKKSSVKASWSRYDDYLLTQYIIRLTPEHPSQFRAYWFDLNKNGVRDLTDNYTVLTLPPDPSPQGYVLDDLLDPNYKVPYTDEYIASIDRELFKDFSLSVSYIFKDKKNAVEDVEKFRGYTADSPWWVPVTVADPGWDAKYGTSDDSQITVYGVKKGAPRSRKWQTNPPEVVIRYQGLEFVFQKRMSQGWQLMGSVTISKTYGNRGGDYGGEGGVYELFDTPNYFVNRYGRTVFDRPLMIKVQASVLLPLDFMLSGYYSYYSGSPWARSLQVQLPNDPATFEYPGTFAEAVLAEAPGTRRTHSRNNLDMRLEKIVNIGRYGKLGFVVDVLNVMGETGYTVTTDPGGYIYNDGRFARWSNYGRLAGVYGLRTFKVSARYSF